MKIMQGIGIGNIKLGINNIELVSILGKPNKIVHIDTTNITRYLYNEFMTSFDFDEDEGSKLCSIESSNPELSLWNKKVIGLKKHELLQLLWEHGCKDYVYEDYETFEIIQCDNIGINFVLNFDIVQEIEVQIIFDINDNVIWPQ